MKTLDELRAWCAGAERVFGDPSKAVGQMFVRFKQTIGPNSGDLVAAFVENELVLNLDGTTVPLPLSLGEAQFDYDVPRLLAFGVVQITPGVWYLTPSLNMPGVLHAFVVVYDVPSPAPWERLITLQ